MKSQVLGDLSWIARAWFDLSIQKDFWMLATNCVWLNIKIKDARSALSCARNKVPAFEKIVRN